MLKCGLVEEADDVVEGVLSVAGESARASCGLKLFEGFRAVIPEFCIALLKPRRRMGDVM